jgi:hypothetical protein
VATSARRGSNSFQIRHIAASPYATKGAMYVDAVMMPCSSIV